MSACQDNTWREADEGNAAGHAVIVRYCRDRGCAHVISTTLRDTLNAGDVPPWLQKPSTTRLGALQLTPIDDAPVRFIELEKRVAKLEGTVSSLATAVANLCGGDNK